MALGDTFGLLFAPSRLERLWRQREVAVAEFAVPVEADPEREAVLATPFESVEETRRRLADLASLLLAAGDRRAVFLTVYREMTEATVRAIEDGAFAHPGWMRRYLVQFAEYYRRAFLAYERGAYGAVPDPWIVAFGTALDGETIVLQDALLGINAHVNYDLALALSDVGLGPDRSGKYADHRRVDDILRRLVSVQQELLARLYAPGLSRLGEQLGALDDEVAAFGLETAREAAWRVASVRVGARWLPVDRYTRWLLSRSATGGAVLILQPTASPATMRVLREIEADEFDLAAFARAFADRARTVL